MGDGWGWEGCGGGRELGGERDMAISRGGNGVRVGLALVIGWREGGRG